MEVILLYRDSYWHDMMEGPVWETDGDVFLRVIVKPRSSERKLVAEHSDSVIVINLKSPAKEGKANTELLKRLSKLLHVSTGDIAIVAGHKSRAKTIQVRGVELEEVLRAFQAVTNDK